MHTVYVDKEVNALVHDGRSKLAYVFDLSMRRAMC